jgi:hypothetical protein
VFISTGILLKKTRIRDKRYLLIFFTKEYWVLHIWYSKYPPIDLGGIIQIRIEKKWVLTMSDGWKIQDTFHYEWLPYSTLALYLRLLFFIKNHLPEGYVNESIFHDYQKCIYYSNKNFKETERYIILLWLKYCKILGILNPIDLEESNGLELYNYINKTSLERFFESLKITQKQIELLSPVIIKLFLSE